MSTELSCHAHAMASFFRCLLSMPGDWLAQLTLCAMVVSYGTTTTSPPRLSCGES